DNTIITNPKEIADLLAQSFVKTSSDRNFDPNFLITKQKIEQRPMDCTHIESTSETQKLNTEIQMHELVSTLNHCKNTSPGPDEIPNILIKMLPSKALEYLLQLFNHIWTNNTFPDIWRTATVIPILKPG
ncbi:hypothetical protein KPH14_012927, partial [Odynerus spinipes]